MLGGAAEAAAFFKRLANPIRLIVVCAFVDGGAFCARPRGRSASGSQAFPSRLPNSRRPGSLPAARNRRPYSTARGTSVSEPSSPYCTTCSAPYLGTYPQVVSGTVESGDDKRHFRTLRSAKSNLQAPGTSDLPHVVRAISRFSARLLRPTLGAAQSRVGSKGEQERPRHPLIQSPAVGKSRPRRTVFRPGEPPR